MTRPRGIGRGRGAGSKATQFARGGKRPKQPRRREGRTGREASKAIPHSRQNTPKYGFGEAAGTARREPRGTPIARESVLAVIRADRQAELDALRRDAEELRAALAEERGRSGRAGAVLRSAHPGAWAAVAGLLGGEAKAEQVPQAGGPAAGAGVAGPGGDPPAGEPAGVTPPAEKRDTRVVLEPGEREARTVSDGVRRRDIPSTFGGTIVSGTPRRRAAGGIGDPYGDNGPLDGRD